LAASLAANNKRVLLIDLDPQAHATLGLNIKADLSIYNVLSKITNKKVTLEEIIKNVDEHFDLAPSNIILSTLEQELAGEIGRDSRLWDTLNHNVNYQLLVNNFDSRLRHSFRILDRIRATFKDRLFSTIVHVNVKLKEAQSEGTHILNYDKYCRGAKDYFSLSREIITQEKVPAVAMPALKERMEEILKERLPRLTEVVFLVLAPEAKEVYVAGDFNNWQLDEHSRMERDGNTWKKRMPLKSGRYHYRFVIDGSWTEDSNNPAQEMNPYGTMDSLLEVSEQNG
jgi:hypothetical protein